MRGLPIHTGIANWKRFWLANRTTNTPSDNGPDILANMWLRPGFIRHATEFWLLVKATVAHLHGSPRNSTEDQVVAGSSEIETPAGLPIKYDSDMSEIHSIITSLQRISLLHL